MGECPCRIVEEHHPETREQDVERALGQLGAAGVGHLEQGRRILGRKCTRSADQRFGDVHAQHLAPCADAGGQSQTRRARAAADIQHALARQWRGGFNRGLAEYRHHGVEPSLVGDPALPALTIPVGDLMGIFLCHASSLTHVSFGERLIGRCSSTVHRMGHEGLVQPARRCPGENH